MPCRNPSPCAPSRLLVTGPLVILGLSGSVQAGSYSRAALRAAAMLLPPGVTLDIFDLPAGPAPAPAGGAGWPQALKARLRTADAVLFAAPEHRYGLLPLLDEALHAAAGPDGGNAWAGKPAAVIGTSRSEHDWGWAQHHLRSRLPGFAMRPIAQPTLVIGPADRAFDRRGALAHASSREAVSALLADLARCAGLADPEAQDLAALPRVQRARRAWSAWWGARLALPGPTRR